jgi:hypothetical protein
MRSGDKTEKNNFNLINGLNNWELKLRNLVERE